MAEEVVEEAMAAEEVEEVTAEVAMAMAASEAGYLAAAVMGEEVA